ncbi:serine/threonine-protein kinase [Pontibacillus litoralis]|uniref:Serine/threonine protein kinase n=1 Tax=Pontibacillus litoralis JSM 072002 TaxID=1385512 RepID=A0A0A5HQZ5_9BACI|nr:serine/threonine-protein kinase [Pontibacillus litoralis]KGX85997.1 serine/threonine protein kinase [Pontibacillus litoralis JSM 072002]
MVNDWRRVIECLNQVVVESNPNNEPVTIYGAVEGLRCIGVGTDAAVFQSPYALDYAFKVYATDRQEKASIEASIYAQLGASRYFPKCYADYETFLVLSYEHGMTLFDCILQGVSIPKQVMEDVEHARAHVREQGLNPRDIHLKNILLQDGRAKIIDVSEYGLSGNDYRWEHIKKAYDEHYHLIAGRPVPFWIMETVRKWYNNRNKRFSSFEDFIESVLKFTSYKKDKEE